jgi:amino acid transporter
VTWRACIVIAFGGAVLITVSMGPMYEALGDASVLVWTGTAIIGAAQCALLAELTARFPARAGGTAQYAYATLARGSPMLGAISAWSYWLAWTPGVAVSVVVASEVIQATVWPDVNETLLAAALAAGVYALNFSGARAVVRAGAVMGALVLAPLVLILLSPLLVPSAFRAESLLPLTPREAGTADLAVVAKWMFVAVWASYGAEMASTLVAEVHDPERTMPLALAIAAGVAVLTFSVVPAVLVGLVGAVPVSDNPATLFLRPANLLLGEAGKATIALMLTAALLLSAAAFVIGSSRTIYQLAEDGHLPAPLAAVSGRGVPIGSVTCDAFVIGVMLTVLGSDVLDFVAAANVGYLVVFVLMPIAYIALGRRVPAGSTPFRLGRWAQPMAAGLAAFNAALLVLGGWQWGPRVMVTGTVLVLLIIPISLWTRRVRIGRAAAPSP